MTDDKQVKLDKIYKEITSLFHQTLWVGAMVLTSIVCIILQIVLHEIYGMPHTIISYIAFGLFFSTLGSSYIYMNKIENRMKDIRKELDL